MTVVPIRQYSLWDPLPPTFPCRFRYQETKKFTCALAAFGTENVWRLNSLYDPDFSGAGVYPYAFTQFQALYKNYRVLAVDIEVEFIDPSVDGMIGGVMVAATGNTTTLATQTIDWAATRPMIAVASVNNTGSQRALVKQRFTIAQVDGVPAAQVQADPNYAALVTGNPTNTPWLRVAVACEDTGNSTATLYAHVRITFQCVLYDRIVL